MTPLTSCINLRVADTGLKAMIGVCGLYLATRRAVDPDVVEVMIAAADRSAAVAQEA